MSNSGTKAQGRDMAENEAKERAGLRAERGDVLDAPHEHDMLSTNATRKDDHERAWVCECGKLEWRTA